MHISILISIAVLKMLSYPLDLPGLVEVIAPSTDSEFGLKTRSARFSKVARYFQIGDRHSESEGTVRFSFGDT
jgi:hypothetical protein